MKHMEKQKIIQITKQGYEEVKAELNELLNVKRPEVVERLERARNEGDLAENSAYHDSKDDLEFLDNRIDELRNVIDNAQILNGNTRKDKVNVGTKVTLNLDGNKHVFHIVGEWEADPLNRRISHESPLGKALAGRKVGEKVEVEAPAGKLIYEILNIE
jgi:transcription elongation factor GreA